MRRIYLFLLLFISFYSYSQISEDFSDGNFTENPLWFGTAGSFIVNDNFELQSNLTEASKSYLFTHSQALDDASWECRVKIESKPSSQNFVRIYLIADAPLIENSNAYYVQIGGSKRDVSLYYSRVGEKKDVKIVSGEENRLNLNKVEMILKVKRSKKGMFEVMTKFVGEDDFTTEGEARGIEDVEAHYFGLMISNTKTIGKKYFFDDIRVTGEKKEDLTPPKLESWDTENEKDLLLTFSEPMNFSGVNFKIENSDLQLLEKKISEDGRSITLSFSSSFETGVFYELSYDNLADKAGNAIEDISFYFGFSESPEQGDVVINEVMFEPIEDGGEYIEIINRSNKIIDVSDLLFALRKNDNTLTAGVAISQKTILVPGHCFALCEDADLVRELYFPSKERSLGTANSWAKLNNEKATIVLISKDNEIVCDEFTYDRKWHHPLLVSNKGVSLERISSFLPTQSVDSWHSAASAVGYGTPGYKNSQYRDVNVPAPEEKFVWVEPEAFSPDNDGNNDVCFIYYKTEEPGYLANVHIFNASGVPIVCLASNSLLESEGQFLWNGKTGDGQSVNTGVYVLYFEMFHPLKGKKRQIKLPIVLSAR